MELHAALLLAPRLDGSYGKNVTLLVDGDSWTRALGEAKYVAKGSFVEGPGSV